MESTHNMLSIEPLFVLFLKNVKIYYEFLELCWLNGIYLIKYIS